MQIKQTCDACPSQWDVIDDTGEAFYVRYRWGELTITHEPTQMMMLRQPLGNPLDGVLSTEDMIPFLYTALGVFYIQKRYEIVRKYKDNA